MAAKTERELKIFVLASHLKKSIKLKKLSWIKISQRYFSDANLEAAYRIIFNKAGQIPPLMTGRLRTSRAKTGVKKYFATFKGPYLSEYSRDEHERQISRSLYQALIVLCQGFAVDKTRYHLPGQLVLGKTKSKIIAEIDHLTSWSDQFFTIDIEVTSDQQIRALRRGHHSFEFLKKGAIDITKEPFSVRRALSMKFLSRNGYSEITKKVVKRLSSKAKTKLETL
jgi:CYTH domain-containing protein